MTQYFTKSIAALLVTCSLVALTACSTPGPDPRFDNPKPISAKKRAFGLLKGKKAPAGRISDGYTGGYITAYAYEHPKFVPALAYNKVRLYQVGGTINVMLPGENFFPHQSTTINPNFYPILDKIIAFLKTQNFSEITVTGYTSNALNAKESLALSRAQAEHIAAYLHAKDVGAPVIHAHGEGRNNPISFNDYSRGRRDNNRIEIAALLIPEHAY